jgi:phage shock protein A
MDSLINQFASILKSGMKTALAPAEDPRKTFIDPWQRQQELLSRVREALAQNSALHKRLEHRIARLQIKVPQLEGTAKQAVTAGRDDLARLALQQRQLALLELKSLTGSAQEVRLEEQRIAIIEQHLTAQIEAMRIRQEMTAARYTAAQSQVIVNEVLSGFSKELADLGETIERTEQKTEYMQAQANAVEEFIDFAALDLSNGTTNNPVARELMQLDIDKAVDEQLRDIKMRLQS